MPTYDVRIEVSEDVERRIMDQAPDGQSFGEGVRALLARFALDDSNTTHGETTQADEEAKP